MNERQIKLYNYVLGEITEHPEDVAIVINAITNGVRNSNERLQASWLKSDKALELLFTGSNFGSDQNLVDVAEALTESHFNGRQHKYTIEDIKPFIKAKLGRPKKS